MLIIKSTNHCLCNSVKATSLLIYSDVLKTFTGLSKPHVSAFTAIFHHSPRSSPRFQFADHCQRIMGEIVQSLVLWMPSGLVHSRRLTDVIARDSGKNRSDLGNAMADRDVLSTVVACIPTSRRTMIMMTTVFFNML